MKKPISPRMHGVLDYSTLLTTAATARLLNFSRPAARTALGWAAGYGALSALTDYPLAVRRTVPFRTHGMVDATLGLMLPMAPWLFGFARDRKARNFFFGLTALTLLVTALTDWNRPVPASR